jgi:two-component system, chemotaxis family, CheB/CheR fusion protein
MAEKKRLQTEAPPKPSTEKRKTQEAPTQPANREPKLTLVGIGASAGGLGALGSFFDSVPVDTGMAFVVVTHLHPEHESHMAELLQRHTRMPTMQVNERLEVEANHVYVIPPNRTIIMTDTHLDTQEFDEPHGRRTPIDHFFRSMAASGHQDPVAVILSGAGTDGAVGVKDVKEVGGMIMVQHPDDAEYDSMPRAAISTGLVDVILPASQLASKLAEYIQHRPNLPHDPGQLTEPELETLQRILGQVHSRTGHDFSQYKRSTILRRVERRMQLNGFVTLEAYLTYLRGNASEAQAMFNDILIGVTNFFRDQESWETLAKKVVPKLFKKKVEEEGIRAWSIGCATGEEAYSLAILLFEEAEQQDFHTHIQVFASDLDERSITHAREGLYPTAIEADVSPERLEKFFFRQGEYYRVKRELRDAVLFTNHNVLRDPPFSRQDLIACRNVLIYLQRPVQARVFDIFNYSLHPDGYLFLGTSESAEHIPDLFTVVDKTHRIYQARALQGERPHVPTMPLALQKRRHAHDLNMARPQAARFMEEPLLAEEQHLRALETFGPPSVIVNERYVIQHVSETAGRYLHLPKGPITGDLLTLVRPELQLELRTALFRAFETGKAAASRMVAVQFNGHKRRVVVAVRPRPAEAGGEKRSERQALVVFIEDEVEDPDEVSEDVFRPSMQGERDEMVSQLQAEIQRLREQLQISMEEYESSNEEMKAANEELQSINEEYRSATEELETSKEELQSVNEELQTVNTEMRNKLDEVSQAHRELENLMGATEIATLYLDRELRIQRFTAGVQDIFNILSVDRGRRISDLTHKMEYNQFMDDAEQVLRRLIPVEHELMRADGRWFLMRLRPYRTVEDHIEGVVITFIDISDLKETEQELVRAKTLLEERVKERTVELDEANYKLTQARDLFRALFNANPIPAALTRLEDEVILDVNIQFLNYFNLPRQDVVGRRVGEFNLLLNGDGQDHDDFVSTVKRDSGVRDFEYELLHPSGERRNILASVQYLKVDNTDTLISAFIDITERVRAERQVRSLASDLTAAEQEERKRISQILHDDLQQRIFAVKMQLFTFYEAYQQGNMQSGQLDLDQLQNLLDESISITRNLSIDLSPAILQGDSLVDALIWLSNQMREQYGLNVTVESGNVSTRFEDTLRILVFQTVREALFNVVKHAGTLTASVSFERTDGQICLTISDEGAGFDSGAATNGQGGLMNVRHRLSLMGCRMQIFSSPGKGTRVIIDIPDKQVK